MRVIHKAGYKIVIVSFIILLSICTLAYFLHPFLFWIFFIASLPALAFVMAFFRIPRRKMIVDDHLVVSPADGKIVVVEKCVDAEYFNDERIQVSVFMSVWNVHINWFPVNGVIKYFRYHPGKFLVAWLPKSSADNERTTIVVETPSKVEILLRQIAGAVARRIETYATEGHEVKQGSEMGFIKFGSRVDLLLPLNAKINVSPGDKSVGGKTIIAELV